jgi:hypothetical protein
MIPLDYLVLRLGRRIVPPSFMRTILQMGVGPTLGLESREPGAAADLYEAALSELGLNWHDRQVMIFGYGGNPELGIELLGRGAKEVVLLDPYARLRQNLLEPREGTTALYFEPRHLSEYVQAGGSVDLVLSWSVLEHVRDPGATVRNMAAVCRPSGAQVHFVDLRDHVFRYPFEMLCHSERTWNRYLDPPSHLNRIRSWEVEEHFVENFERVTVESWESDSKAFRRALPRIRSEFLSGDEVADAATRLRVLAAQPREAGPPPG